MISHLNFNKLTFDKRQYKTRLSSTNIPKKHLIGRTERNRTEAEASHHRNGRLKGLQAICLSRRRRRRKIVEWQDAIPILRSLLNHNRGAIFFQDKRKYPNTKYETSLQCLV
uniref:Ras-related protein RHN1 isoform X1 n=1 Tax=Rhizophora mucronata TaxID=61149 RepID=A0A2P2JA99_RHIMU